MPYGYVDKMFKPRESADAILATVLLQWRHIMILIEKKKERRKEKREKKEM